MQKPQIFNATANENARNKRNELESKSFLCDDFLYEKKMWCEVVKYNH